jgi:hypothetical protein
VSDDRHHDEIILGTRAGGSTRALRPTVTGNVRRTRIPERGRTRIPKRAGCPLRERGRVAARLG